MGSRLSLLLIGALAGAGCHRAVRPDLGEDRTVEAGVPVTLGRPDGPELEWDFGDGSPPVRQRQVRHAFDRAGEFSVRTLEGGKEVARVRLTAVPRAVTRAIPPGAEAALWLPRLEGNLETSVDFLERLAGAEQAQRLLDSLPLVPAVMELSAGQARGVDPQEGLGVFTLPGFAGLVGLVGVERVEPAMDALVRGLAESGATGSTDPEGVVLLRMPNGREAAVFADRGYLFFAVPSGDDEESSGESDRSALLGVLRSVREASEAGLDEGGASRRHRLLDGNAYLYLRVSEQGDGVRGLVGSLRVADRALKLDGLLLADAPLVGAHPPGRPPPLLSQAPEGAVAAALVSLPPRELATLLVGHPDSPRRRRNAERFRRAGLELGSMVDALTGGVAAVAYFDAEAFLENLIAGSERPEPRGSILIEAGLSRPEQMEELAARLLESAELRFDAVRERGLTLFKTSAAGQPLEVMIQPHSVRVAGGTGWSGRPKVDLASQLNQRLEGAFSPGHVSLFVDLGQLRRDIEQPRTLPGIDPRRLVAVQGFSSAFLTQLTPVEHVFLDMVRDDEGARLRGRVQLRGRE